MKKSSYGVGYLKKTSKLGLMLFISVFMMLTLIQPSLFKKIVIELWKHKLWNCLNQKPGFIWMGQFYNFFLFLISVIWGTLSSLLLQKLLQIKCFFYFVTTTSSMPMLIIISYPLIPKINCFSEPFWIIIHSIGLFPVCHK